MAINARSKGNKTERRAASLVSDWADKKFSRVPSSGGLNWKAAHAKGDITCTEEGHYFPICMEIKGYAEIDFSKLLREDIKESQIAKFWKQCNNDARKAKKAPMLMMRYNGLPRDFFFVAINKSTYSLIKPFLPSKHLYIVTNRLVIITSKDLFTTPYKKIRKILKAYLKRRYG